MSSDRVRDYKNVGRTGNARRQRAEAGVQLRKEKRNDQLMKRRQITARGGDAFVGGGGGGAVAGGAVAGGGGGVASGLAGEAIIGEQDSGEVDCDHYDLEDLTMGILSDNFEHQLEATEKFRRILSRDSNPPIQEVIDLNVLPRLVEFLRDAAHPDLQFEACWALTNVASGTTEQTGAVVAVGAPPILVELLSSVSPQVREQAVWCLGNVAGENEQCRDYVTSLGIMGPLLRMLEDTISSPDSDLEAIVSMCRNATWTLSNLCRGRNPPANFEDVKPSLPCLAHLLHHRDIAVITDTLWALSYISDGDNVQIKAVIDVGVCMRLVELLQ